MKFLSLNFFTAEISKKVQAGVRPQFDDGQSPNPDFPALIRECWNADPVGRPSMKEILQRLLKIYASSTDSPIFLNESIHDLKDIQTKPENVTSSITHTKTQKLSFMSKVGVAEVIFCSLLRNFSMKF
jgi:hypothetical protein